MLVGGETLEVAGITFEVLAVPGHSPAHVAYHADGALMAPQQYERTECVRR